MNAVVDFPLQSIANTGSSATCSMDWGSSAPTKPDWLIKGLKVGPQRSAEPPPASITLPIFGTSPDEVRRRKRFYFGLCRNKREVAEFFEDILYLHQCRNKHGEPLLENVRYGDQLTKSYWWGRTREQWARKRQCTVHQVDYALKLLREWGLVDTCSAKVFGRKVLQVRATVCRGAAHVNGWPAPCNFDFMFKPESLTQQGPAGSFSEMAISENSEMAISEFSEIKNLEALNSLREVEKTLTHLATFHVAGDTRPDDSGQTDPEVVKEGSGIAQSQSSSKHADDIYTAWNRAMGRHNRTAIWLAGVNDRSKLERIDFKMRAAGLRSSPAEWVGHLVSNWDWFVDAVTEVRPEAIMKANSNRPNPGFILEHRDVLFRLVRADEQLDDQARALACEGTDHASN